MSRAEIDARVRARHEARVAGMQAYESAKPTRPALSPEARTDAREVEAARCRVIMATGARLGSAYTSFTEHLAYETDLTAEQAIKCLEITAADNANRRPSKPPVALEDDGAPAQAAGLARPNPARQSAGSTSWSKAIERTNARVAHVSGMISDRDRP